MNSRSERRRHPRYFVSQQLHVPCTLRVGEELYLGKITELSAGGFLMAAARRVPLADDAYWEIQFGGQVLRGQGRPDGRDDTHVAVILAEPRELLPLIAHIRASGSPMGGIERRDSRARVRGFLDFGTARHLLRQIRSGDREIDLSDCEDLDSSGLGVLLIAQRDGVKLHGCRGKVLKIVNIVGMCRHCAPNPDCPGQNPALLAGV